MSQPILMIEAYSLFEFLAKLQVAILQGYELSDKNEHCPVNYGNQYVVTLTKPEEKVSLTEVDIEIEVNEEVASDAEQEPPKAKAGRKPKNST